MQSDDLRQWMNLCEKRRLNETLAIPDLSRFYDAATRDCIANLDMSGSDGEMLVQEFVEDENIDPDEVDLSKGKQRNAFNAFVYNYIHSAVQEVEWDIRSKATSIGSSMVIWRAITAPRDWVKNGGIQAQPLGKYWSFI